MSDAPILERLPSASADWRALFMASVATAPCPAPGAQRAVGVAQGPGVSERRRVDPDGAPVGRGGPPGPAEPARTDQCPFCVGGLEAPEPYDVKAFPNRWPPMPDDRCEIVLYTPDHDATFASLGPAGPAGWSTSGPSAPPPSAPATTWPTSWCSRTGAPRSARPSPTPTARSTPTTRSRRSPPGAGARRLPAVRAAPDELLVHEVGGWRAQRPRGRPTGPTACSSPRRPTSRTCRRSTTTAPDGLAAALVDALRPSRPAVRRADALHGLVPPAPHRRRGVARGPPPPPRRPVPPLAGYAPLRGRRRSRRRHLLQPRRPRAAAQPSAMPDPPFWSLRARAPSHRTVHRLGLAVSPHAAPERASA